MEERRPEPARKTVEALRDQGREVRASISERPLLAVGVAALAGFVVGGGSGTRVGVAALMLIARMAIRDVLAQTIADSLHSGNYDRRGDVMIH